MMTKGRLVREREKHCVDFEDDASLQTGRQEQKGSWLRLAVQILLPAHAKELEIGSNTQLAITGAQSSNSSHKHMHNNSSSRTAPKCPDFRDLGPSSEDYSNFSQAKEMPPMVPYEDPALALASVVLQR